MNQRANERTKELIKVVQLSLRIYQSTQRIPINPESSKQTAMEKSGQKKVVIEHDERQVGSVKPKPQLGLRNTLPENDFIHEKLSIYTGKAMFSERSKVVNFLWVFCSRRYVEQWLFWSWFSSTEAGVSSSLSALDTISIIRVLIEKKCYFDFVRTHTICYKQVKRRCVFYCYRTDSDTGQMLNPDADFKQSHCRVLLNLLVCTTQTQVKIFVSVYI